MRQRTGNKPPAIWPLKGEHRKPEFQTVPNTPTATNPEISEIPEIQLFQRNYLDPQTPITAIQYQY